MKKIVQIVGVLLFLLITNESMATEITSIFVRVGETVRINVNQIFDDSEEGRIEVRSPLTGKWEDITDIGVYVILNIQPEQQGLYEFRKKTGTVVLTRAVRIIVTNLNARFVNLERGKNEWKIYGLKPEKVFVV